MSKLQEKKQRVRELVAIITLHLGKFLTRDKKARIDEEEGRLDFRLNELLKESERRQKELADEITEKGEDLKIESMERIVKLLNGNT